MTEKTIYFSPNLGTILFWTFLFITILANFIISVVLVPIMLVMSKAYLYGSVVFIGFCFGFLLSSIVSAIETLETKHHIITWLFIPAIALVNVFIFTVLSNNLIGILKLSTPKHDPLILAASYVVAFMLPYFAVHFIRFKKNKR